MPRIRTVKPEMAWNEDLAECSPLAQLLAVRVLNHADDEGYFKANPALIKGTCFPLLDISHDEVDSLLRELEGHYVQLGRGDDGKLYGVVTNFKEHQAVNKPRPSKIKKLFVPNGPGTEGSRTAPVADTETDGTENGELPQGMEGNGMEGKGKERGSRAKARSAPPAKQKRGTRWTADEVPEEYIRDVVKRYGVTVQQAKRAGERFCNFWKGKAGKDGVKLDWLATFRNWILGDLERNEKDGKGTGRSRLTPAEQAAKDEAAYLAGESAGVES